MKILLLNTNIGYGGASKMMACIANTLCDKHEVVFLTFRSDVVLQKLQPQVKYVFDSLYSSTSKPIEMIGQIVALHRYLLAEQFDVAIAFLHPSHYMLTLAAIGTNTKVVLSERGDPFSRKKDKRLFVHLVEWIIHHADAYVFQSYGAMKGYPNKCRRKGCVIVNAVPDKAYPTYELNHVEKTIFHVARFEVKQKRQDIMLKAFAEFRKNHPDYQLHFLGDGPDEDQIKELANKLGLKSAVVFHGAQTDIYKHLVKASMFVLTSDYEGLPNALLEAMSMGIPCISTDCSPGGARMIIEDGINGYLVPCGDIEGLSKRMCELADNEEERSLFSQRAVSIKERFNERQVNAAWNSFINSL